MVVSPYPSPSVASSNHHASGRNAQETSSSSSGNSISGSGSGSSTSTTIPEQAQGTKVVSGLSSTNPSTSNILPASTPQDVPSAIAFDNAFTRGSIFPTAGTSSSTLASLPAWQSPLFTTNHPHPHPQPHHHSSGIHQSNPGSGSSSPFSIQSPINNSQHATSKNDPLGRQLHNALPSYLKIPTTIPSTYASTPSAPPSPSPTPSSHNRSSSSSPTSQQFVASRSSSMSEEGSGSSVDEDELEQQSVGTAESDDGNLEKVGDDDVTPSAQPLSASPWDKNPELAASSGGSTPARPVLAPSGAAAAVLSLDDVVIEPGHASKVSSPEEQREVTDQNGGVQEGKSRDDQMEAEGGLLGEAGQRIQEEQEKKGSTNQIEGDPTTSEAPDASTSPEGLQQSAAGSTTTVSSSAYSRTPTPTPETVPGARALTPTGTPTSFNQPLKSLSSISSSDSGSMASSSEGGGSGGRRLNVITGGESGVNTPALPPGLTSAPPSASSSTISTPSPHHQGNGHFNALQYRMTQAHPTPSTPGEPSSSSGRKRRSEGGVSTGSTSTVNSTSTTPTATPTSSRGFTSTNGGGGTQSGVQSPSAPLMPIVLTWRGGGREVFVTGTFANEWRSKILLKRNSSGISSSNSTGISSSFLPQNQSGGAGHKYSNSAGGGGKRGEREHSCVLHLPPGTHRLKFIVDDRWRVSRHLATATDGDGNLVNYVEIPNVGPAHNGPLSAPGEDLLEGGSDGERRRARERERSRSRAGVEMERKTSRSSTGTIGKDNNTNNTLTQVVPGDNALATLTAKEDLLASPKTKKSLELKNNNNNLNDQIDDENEPRVEEQRARVHKQTLDLVAEARKAEAQRRGELDDVFGEDEGE